MKPVYSFQQLNHYMEEQKKLIPGNEWYQSMHAYSLEAARLTAILNSGYHEEGEQQKLFEQLFGKALEGRIALPFYTDYGKNIHLGKNVFVNCSCQFQDQGGITIEEGTLVGPKTVIATINHALKPELRSILELKPVHIGKNVWIGASVVILPGVSIGDNSVIAAGAVVNKDVPPDCVAGGVPARIIKMIDQGQTS